MHLSIPVPIYIHSQRSLSCLYSLMNSRNGIFFNSSIHLNNAMPSRKEMEAEDVIFLPCTRQSADVPNTFLLRVMQPAVIL